MSSSRTVVAIRNVCPHVHQREGSQHDMPWTHGMENFSIMAAIILKLLYNINAIAFTHNDLAQYSAVMKIRDHGGGSQRSASI